MGRAVGLGMERFGRNLDGMGKGIGSVLGLGVDLGREPVLGLAG